MSDDYFDSALKSLKKPQDELRLRKILFAVRKDIEWPNKRENIIKLREAGCLKHVVLCLQRKDAKIIEISLSILGNCCMDQSSARDVVRKHGILPILNNLLLEQKVDSIYGRIFRIIGNISHHWERLSNAIVEKQPQLIKNIVKIIMADTVQTEDSSEIKLSSATIIMGIRALRELLNLSLAEELIKKHEIIKMSAAVLIKYTKRWLTSKDNEDILNNVLRLLIKYSMYVYRDILMELQNTPLGNSIGYLGKLITLAPFDVVKLIMNLTRVCTVTTDLPVAEVTQILIENLKTENQQKDDFKTREYLKCLCFLLQCVANREEMKKLGIIPAFMDFLRNCQSPSVVTLKNCIWVVLRLKNCLFDEVSMNTLIKQGIIEILEDKLEWLVGNSIELDVTHEFKKRKNSAEENLKRKKECIENYPDLILPDRTGNNHCLLFREDCDIGGVRCASPSSGSEFSFSSGPSFTPPSSPALNENDLTGLDESDSDEYSPVCSEVEDVEEDSDIISVTLDDLDCNFSKDKGTESETGTSTTDETFSLNVALSKEIVCLIRRYTKRRPVFSELVSRRLLIALLKLICPYNSCYSLIESQQLILEILQHQEYLLPLMQIDVIPIIYGLTANVHGDECSVCVYLNNVGQTLLKKITHLAESSFGRGEIAHYLSRGNPTLKQKLALDIPYIIRNKNLFGKFMVNYGGLETITNLFREENFQKKCIKSLCAMADRKGIKNPLSDSSVQTKEVNVMYDNYECVAKDDCKKVVTFELDDQSVVIADRDFLIQQSDFFERLLSGTFKESLEDRVKLCNVENKSLKCLLLLMKENIKWPVVPIVDLDLSTILDVIVLTDRYLVMNLCNSLVSYVEKFRISSKTAPIIYKWSLESGTNLLRVETVAFALVANMSDCEKFTMFQSFFDLGFSEQIIDDILNLLRR